MAGRSLGNSSASSRRAQQLAGIASNLFEPSINQPLQAEGITKTTLQIISSPDHVFQVVRSFDQRKKELVRSIGFGGLLQLCRFGPLDPHFTVWLFRKVRWKPRILALSQQINLHMKPEHIGKIIGIPYSGIEVGEKAFRDEDDRLAFMKQSLSFLRNEDQLLQSAEAYLARDVPFSFSKEDAHRFKVAFVIFVMGRLLAPSVDTSPYRSDYFGALKNPDSIHSFNWASFVLADTMEASRLVVWSLLRNINVSAIFGCPLIIQIFYLDNIDLRQLNLPHDVLPRVKVFNSSLLSRMIEADYDADESTSAEPIYGCTKTLRTDNICYSFHNAAPAATAPHCSDIPQPPASPHVSICQTHEATRIVRCTGKQTSNHNNIMNHEKPSSSAYSFSETDVPDFSMIMREYFQGQVDPALLDCFRFHQAMCFQHLTKFVNGLKSAITKENINLVSKVVNHQRLSSGLSPINLDVCRPSVMRRTYDEMLSGGESGEENTPASNNSKQLRRFGGFEKSIPKKDIALARIGTIPGASPPPLPLTSSPQNCIVDPDIFKTPVNTSMKHKWASELPIISSTSGHTNFVDWQYSNLHKTKKKVQPGAMVVPHWERNIDHPIRDFALTHSFYDWLSSTTGPDLKQPWIIHDFPRYIQMSGQQLKDHFTDIEPMHYDAFDLCVRRTRQLDKYICPKDLQLRWRHLIESDFSMHFLGGESLSNNLSIRRQFGSGLIDYELERCRMFFVPVLVEGLWWCYAWDLKYMTVTINDPSVGQESDAIVIQKHAGTIELLAKALLETVLDFYSGWSPNFPICNPVVFRCQDMPIDRSKSALYTLFFMKNYNGTSLVSTTTLNALKNFKECMLYEILEMKDNRAKPPSVYRQCVGA